MSVRIGEILVEKQLITEEQLVRAVAEHQKSKEFLGQTLIRLGFISEEKLLKVLADQQGLTFLSLRDVKFDDEIIKKMPAKFAWHYKIMPITLNGNVLTVATSNPFDMWSIDDLETNLGYRVETVLALSSDIVDAIRKYYGVGAETIERILADKPQEEKTAQDTAANEKIEDLETSPDAASVVKLVNHRRDGSAFVNELYVSPVFGPHGELLYFFGSQLDVTRFREREEEIAGSGASLQCALRSSVTCGLYSRRSNLKRCAARRCFSVSARRASCCGTWRGAAYTMWLCPQ